MKKLISVLAAVLITVSAIHVFAGAETAAADNQPLISVFPGYVHEVSDNGTIRYERNAAAARDVLRYSAKLADLNDYQMQAADVNFDRKIDASDARSLLRYTAKLENFRIRLCKGQTLTFGPDVGWWTLDSVTVSSDCLRIEKIQEEMDSVSAVPGDYARQFLLVTPEQAGVFEFEAEVRGFAGETEQNARFDIFCDGSTDSRIRISHVSYTDDERLFENGRNADRLQMPATQKGSHLPVYVFDTEEQFSAFKIVCSDYTGLVLDQTGADGFWPFNKQTAEYDAAYFADNSLVLVYVPAASGSDRFGVKNISTEDGSFCMNVEKNSPFVSDCMMSGWFITCEITDSDAAAITSFDAVLAETALHEDPDMPDNGNSAISTFGTKLFSAAYKEGENTLVSPVSVYTALTMLSAGADGNTLSQLEKTLGAEYSAIKSGVSGYMESIKDSETLKSANSVWMRDDELLSVKEDFIKENTDFFGADIYKEPFNSDTVGKVNGWVKDKTDGMIPQIIGELSPADMLILINALAFDCEWARKYISDYVKEGVFNNYDGTKQPVFFLHGSESKYIGSDEAVGFIKDYKDRRYSFVGLMPADVNTKLSGFMTALRNGNHLSDLISSMRYADVYLTFPKFEISYSDSLVDELAALGVTDAFLPEKADFNRMGQYGDSDNSLCVSDVLHKTFISVTEDGTRAAAVTSVVIEATAANPEYRKTLVFDRPFVYAIWDNQYNIPLFIGAVEKL